ncbi:MAG: DUF255 domain-containing protein [Nanoarchaeota archaeon]
MKTKINWLDWNKESFEKANKEDKPILLDLTAIWCHWCHVMDSISYSDDEIANIIKNGFIPIKVYIDKRPDIRERYNMGGFPSTVFLSPKGDIIAGDTYVPPARLKLMLEKVKEAWKKSKGEINKNVIEQPAKIQKEKIFSKSGIRPDIVNEVLLAVEDNFDRFYGGFGAQPKFPFPDVLDLLFLQYKKTHNKKYLEVALKTLDGMYEGIYDKTDFGFFRYSVTQDWKMPHYEKMLDTNAGALRNYADAFSITKDERYRKVTEEITIYISKSLSDQNNAGFYGSQDADEEFYRLRPEERKNMQPPYVDKTIYTDLNAMMTSSYLKSGIILNDKEMINFAVKTINFILKNCYDPKYGLCHFFDGKPNVKGLLSDNIYFLNCLIDAYSITHEQGYLEASKKISGFILKSFYDSKKYGFFDKVLDKDDLGKLKHQEKSFLENTFCAIVFLKLYFLLKEEEYKKVAEKTLLFFSDNYSNFGYFASAYAIAVDMLLNNEMK